MFHKIFPAAVTIALVTPACAQSLCIYDPMGTSGDMYNMAKDFALEMRSDNVQLTLRAYTNEGTAAADLMAGQCDGLFATGLRTRQFNAVAGSIDALGATNILRQNKIDVPASYEVVRKTVQILAPPAARHLMISGNFEVGGIIPIGAAYPVVRDRSLNTVEALAGKKIATFDTDRAGAVMVQKIGAQAVPADVTSFAGKFNNGSVDMIAAPASLYRPLELYRGIGSKGAINRFPILMMTYQVILNKNSFSEDFGFKARQYWSGQFDRAMNLIRTSEKAIPAGTWGELAPENLAKYDLLLRNARASLVEQGIYNKQGLALIKRVRCSINPADAECSMTTQ